MPNYCYNILKVFFEENRNTTENNDEEESFLSFSKSVPQPEDNSDWYNWNCENWGTKWNAIDVELNNFQHDVPKSEFTISSDTTEITYYFSTAWGPALAWLDTVAKKYPQISFSNEYSESGMDFYGKREYDNGEMTSDYQDNLSTYNWNLVDKTLLLELINNKLNGEDIQDIDYLVDEIVEEYNDCNDYLENISCYVEEEIKKVIQSRQDSSHSISLNYDNEGKDINQLEF